MPAASASASAPSPEPPRGTTLILLLAEALGRARHRRVPRPRRAARQLASVPRRSGGAWPGAGRDQLADDDVLLQAEQVVLAGDRRLGEHAGGLLEGGRRQEALGVQRGLGDAQQHRLGRRRLTALGQHPAVHLLELEAIDQLARQQLGVARLVDAHLAQHLANDDLDVLVVDVHTLRAVDPLDLVDQVTLHRVAALDAQDLLRVWSPRSAARRRGPLAVLDHQRAEAGTGYSRSSRSSLRIDQARRLRSLIGPRSAARRSATAVPRPRRRPTTCSTSTTSPSSTSSS